MEWSRITARGSEAQTFLHGQLSQDISDINDRGEWSLVLTPTSEVISSAWVARIDDGYVLYVARELAEVVMARLKRFLLRTDCQLELEACLDGPIATVGDQVHEGIPGPHEFGRHLTPQCFGAQFVSRTVSFTKGCFTGQELVGRLDARGAVVPWRMVRCVGPSIERLDQALGSKGPEGPQGVTTAIFDDSGILGIGFVHRSALAEGALASFSDVTVTAIA